MKIEDGIRQTQSGGFEMQMYRGINNMSDVEFSWHPISAEVLAEWREKKKGGWVMCELDENGWVKVTAPK